MKHPSLLSLCLFLFVSPVEARVGENQASVEARLLAANAAKYTIKAKNKKGDSILEQKLHSFRFNYIFQYLPEGTKPEVCIYYKAVGEKAVASLAAMESDNSPPGWEYTVYYHNNTSQLETYKRSQGLNQLEINGIMNMNRGDSRWVKAEDVKDENGEVKKLDTILGYTHVRADGALRAIVDGASITIYAARFDEGLHEAKKRKEAETLPDSLKGF